MESSSLKWKDIEVKIESEKMEFENIVKPKVEIKTEKKEFENIVKPKVEIKTEEDLKIKLESNDEDLQIGLGVIENLNAPFDNKFHNSSQLKNNPLKVEIRNDIKTESGQTENFNSNDFDSDLIAKQEFEEKPKIEILKKESYENRKELDAELENGLDEIEKMDFKDVSNPINIKKPHKCSICKASFSQKHKLFNHMISSSHEGKKKSHKCSMCESTFGYKSGLRQHFESVHESKKLYNYDSCESRFSEKSKLNVHVATIHEGKKPYKSVKCSMCESTFEYKSGLRRHFESVHEGKKPYKCDIVIVVNQGFLKNPN